MPSNTMLVDGHNILMRSIHAASRSGMATSDGAYSTGPLTVFINMLSSYVRAWKPDALVVCWDHGPSERRREIFPAYKAARKEAPQVDDQDTHFGLAKRFLALCDIQQVAIPGYEADDVIAAYCHKVGGNRIIISGDKDLLQLLHPGVVQLRPTNGGGHEIWTPDKVVEHYGCDPSDLPLLMALAGDATDGIPGVPGIGPKKALSGLQKACWVLDDVAVLQDPEKRSAAYLSLALVDLTDCQYHPEIPAPRPFKPLYVGDPGGGYLMTFVASMEMIGIGNKLVHQTLWS